MKRTTMELNGYLSFIYENNNKTDKLIEKLSLENMRGIKYVHKKSEKNVNFKEFFIEV